MVVRWISVLAATAAGFSAGEAAAPQAMSFNCDAPPGELSTMDRDRLAGANAISGNLRAIEGREDNNLDPTATVRFASRKDFVALQLAPTSHDSGRFVIVVRKGDAHEEERTLLGEVGLNEAMPFRVTRSGKDIIIEAAGQSVSVRQSFRGAPSMGVTCSTGHFLFDNLQVQ
jgi:hypothetical protein